MTDWKPHLYRVGTKVVQLDNAPDNCDSHRKYIEPWLAALFQSEHLSLLLGSGLTIAVSSIVGRSATSMEPRPFSSGLDSIIEKNAQKEAASLNRGRPNIEDQIRVANQLLAGMSILDDPRAEGLARDINSILSGFLESLLTTERAILSADDLQRGENLLQEFLLSFASRASSRDRLNIFTTNYDRLIEYGCELAGLHILDRFVGYLNPIFRSSRLSLDIHYNPPGIRGEPRYLEGVVRLGKLHGSLDWHWTGGVLRRHPLPFGGLSDSSILTKDPLSTVMVYPNSAKDVETLNFPYAELFRDFSAALCRPNSVLVTYGYGFGDDHINRVLRDMLSIPSTHLAVISYGDQDSRIRTFCDSAGHEAQVSLLIGSHFGDIVTLVENYLPKPAIDMIAFKKSEIGRKRLDQSAGLDMESGNL